jgi:uncharacterized protein (DUF1778 family)
MQATISSTDQRGVITAMRLDKSERALVDAAAKIGSVTVSELLRSIVVPEVTRRVARSAVEQGR